MEKANHAKKALKSKLLDETQRLLARNDRNQDSFSVIVTESKAPQPLFTIGDILPIPENSKNLKTIPTNFPKNGNKTNQNVSNLIHHVSSPPLSLSMAKATKYHVLRNKSQTKINNKELQMENQGATLYSDDDDAMDGDSVNKNQALFDEKTPSTTSKTNNKTNLLPIKTGDNRETNISGFPLPISYMADNIFVNDIRSSPYHSHHYNEDLEREGREKFIAPTFMPSTHYTGQKMLSTNAYTSSTHNKRYYQRRRKKKKQKSFPISLPTNLGDEKNHDIELEVFNQIPLKEPQLQQENQENRFSTQELHEPIKDVPTKDIIGGDIKKSIKFAPTHNDVNNGSQTSPVDKQNITTSSPRLDKKSSKKAASLPGVSRHELMPAISRRLIRTKRLAKNLMKEGIENMQDTKFEHAITDFTSSLGQTVRHRSGTIISQLAVLKKMKKKPKKHAVKNIYVQLNHFYISPEILQDNLSLHSDISVNFAPYLKHDMDFDNHFDNVDMNNETDVKNDQNDYNKSNMKNDLVDKKHLGVWLERARWIKYEETIEWSLFEDTYESGHWSKPHVPFLSFYSLLELRKQLSMGIVMFDVEFDDYESLIAYITNVLLKRDSLNETEAKLFRNALMCPYKFPQFFASKFFRTGVFQNIFGHHHHHGVNGESNQHTDGPHNPLKKFSFSTASFGTLKRNSNSNVSLSRRGTGNTINTTANNSRKVSLNIPSSSTLSSAKNSLKVTFRKISSTPSFGKFRKRSSSSIKTELLNDSPVALQTTFENNDAYNGQEPDMNSQSFDTSDANAHNKRLSLTHQSPYPKTTILQVPRLTSIQEGNLVNFSTTKVVRKRPYDDMDSSLTHISSADSLDENNHNSKRFSKENLEGSAESFRKGKKRASSGTKKLSFQTSQRQSDPPSPTKSILKKTSRFPKLSLDQSRRSSTKRSSLLTTNTHYADKIGSGILNSLAGGYDISKRIIPDSEGALVLSGALPFLRYGPRRKNPISVFVRLDSPIIVDPHSLTMIDSSNKDPSALKSENMQLLEVSSIPIRFIYILVGPASNEYFDEDAVDEEFSETFSRPRTPSLVSGSKGNHQNTFFPPNTNHNGGATSREKSPSVSASIGDPDELDAYFSRKRTSTISLINWTNKPKGLPNSNQSGAAFTSDIDYYDIGRCFSTLMANKFFQEIAYQATHCRELVLAFNEFLNESIVIPSGEISVNTLLPLSHLYKDRLSGNGKPHFGDTQLKSGKEPLTPSATHEHANKSKNVISPAMPTNCCPPRKPFAGLWQDICVKAPWYKSDFTDALSIKCVLTILFIYLTSVIPSITFGGLLSEKTDNWLGVSEIMVADTIGGIIFALFAGQPLLIVTVTGPLLVFEESLYQFTKAYHIDFLAFRVWIGVWVALITIIAVGIDVCFLIRYFTRFIEEIFALTIALVFIYEVFKKIHKLFKSYPLIPEYCHLSIQPGPKIDNKSLVAFEKNLMLTQSYIPLQTHYYEYNNYYYTPNTIMNKPVLMPLQMDTKFNYTDYEIITSNNASTGLVMGVKGSQYSYPIKRSLPQIQENLSHPVDKGKQIASKLAHDNAEDASLIIPRLFYQPQENTVMETNTSTNLFKIRKKDKNKSNPKNDNNIKHDTNVSTMHLSHEKNMQTSNFYDNIPLRNTTKTLENNGTKSSHHKLNFYQGSLKQYHNYFYEFEETASYYRNSKFAYESSNRSNAALFHPKSRLRSHQSILWSTQQKDIPYNFTFFYTPVLPYHDINFTRLYAGVNQAPDGHLILDRDFKRVKLIRPNTALYGTLLILATFFLAYLLRSLGGASANPSSSSYYRSAYRSKPLRNILQPQPSKQDIGSSGSEGEEGRDENLLNKRNKKAAKKIGTKKLSSVKMAGLGGIYSSSATGPQWSTSVSSRETIDNYRQFLATMIPPSLRKTIGAFGPPIALLFATLLDTHVIGNRVYIEKLNLHASFHENNRRFISQILLRNTTLHNRTLVQNLPDTSSILPPTSLSLLSPTLPELRHWIIDPFAQNKIQLAHIFLASLPAAMLFILLFIEGQLTALLINRKERKLKKGTGYNLDLLIVGLIQIFMGFFGLPWVSPAPIQSLAHVACLSYYNTREHAPGDRPKIVAVREQRMTALFVSILSGCTLLFASSLLQKIPVAALFGVILYLGFSALNGIQFFERLKLLFAPPKYYTRIVTENAYVRKVPFAKIHFFTTIQLMCLIALWVIKFTPLSLLFPVLLVITVVLRFQLKCCFDSQDLAYLDMEEEGGESDGEFDFYTEAHMPL